MRFIFAAGTAAIQQATTSTRFFLTLDKMPTVEIDANVELLVGRNACTLLLENDTNRATNAKVINSFDMIMQMADDERRLNALKSLLESIRSAPHRTYFLFFDTRNEAETPIEFRMKLTCVRADNRPPTPPRPTTFEARVPLAAFTRHEGTSVKYTHDSVVSVCGTARKSIINGFAMLCVQTIDIKGWTPVNDAVAAAPVG